MISDCYHEKCVLPSQLQYARLHSLMQVMQRFEMEKEILHFLLLLVLFPCPTFLFPFCTEMKSSYLRKNLLSMQRESSNVNIYQLQRRMKRKLRFLRFSSFVVFRCIHGKKIGKRKSSGCV